MTNEQKQVKDWMVAFGQETPEKPTIPSLKVRKLRAKLIWEEAVKELILNGLGIGIYVKNQDNEYDLIQDFEDIIFEEISDDRANLKEIADGCEDLKVVTEGTLVACGLIDRTQSTIGFKHGKDEKDLILESINDPLFDEVMRSNWTKLWTVSDLGQAKSSLIMYDQKAVFPEKMGNVTKTHYVIKDKDGKVIKSPSYKPANLQPIIDELSK